MHVFKLKVFQQNIMEKADTLGLIWMSAGNPYFTEKRIAEILHFASEHYAKVIIMAPDEPAEHNFKAAGYPDNQAKRKARLNANLLQNRAKRVVASLSPELKNRIIVVEWVAEVIHNSIYKEKYNEILKLYHANASFKKDAREITKKVIAKKTGTDIEKSLDEAVQYLLKELAFVLASPGIYKVKKIVYLYHTTWSIYQKLIEGAYDGVPRTNLGFLLTNIN